MNDDREYRCGTVCHCGAKKWPGGKQCRGCYRKKHYVSAADSILKLATLPQYRQLDPSHAEHIFGIRTGVIGLTICAEESRVPVPRESDKQ